MDCFLPKDKDSKANTRDCADWEETHRLSHTFVAPESEGIVIHYNVDGCWIVVVWDQDAIEGLDVPLVYEFGRGRVRREATSKKSNEPVQKWIQKEVRGVKIWVKDRKRKLVRLL